MKPSKFIAVCVATGEVIASSIHHGDAVAEARRWVQAQPGRKATVYAANFTVWSSVVVHDDLPKAGVE